MFVAVGCAGDGGLSTPTPILPTKESAPEETRVLPCEIGTVLAVGDACRGEEYTMYNDGDGLSAHGALDGITLSGARLTGPTIRLNQMLIERSGDAYTIKSLP